MRIAYLGLPSRGDLLQAWADAASAREHAAMALALCMRRGQDCAAELLDFSVADREYEHLRAAWATTCDAPET